MKSDKTVALYLAAIAKEGRPGDYAQPRPEFTPYERSRMFRDKLRFDRGWRRLCQQLGPWQIPEDTWDNRMELLAQLSEGK